MSLGQALQSSRKQQHLTQKQVAIGICAQSMLSAIENDRYVPNARLLIALCERLNISLSQISLAHDFDINPDAELNTQLHQLCNQHQYQELQQLLLTPTTIQRVSTAEQTQAYHYYLAVTQIQLNSDLAAAQLNLKLASSLTEETGPTILTHLATATLAVIKAKLHQRASGQALIKQALTNLERLPDDENQNIIYYLDALVAYFLNDLELARRHLLTAIAVITAHHSHYMLANCYRLLAELAVRQEQFDAAQDARQKQQFLTELFHETVPEKF